VTVSHRGGGVQRRRAERVQPGSEGTRAAESHATSSNTKCCVLVHGTVYTVWVHGSDGCYKQGVAGNKKGAFEVEAQFLSKLHTNNGYFFLNYD
jgi:hypothetical protein